MNASPSTALIVALVLTLSACGQTGPLYLPDSHGAEPVQPEPVPGDPSSESRRDRKVKPGTEDVPATDTQTPVAPPDPDRPSTPPTPGN